MSDMDYYFFPFSRRAAAADIDTLAAGPDGRAQAHLKLQVERLGGDPVPPAPAPTPGLTVLGPGDVIGLDPSQVARVSPHVDDNNTEPNYLAAIEFYYPDLPWLFSPRAPAGAQLQPWMALVVVPEPNGPRVFSRPGSPNPVLVADPGELPNLDEAWAWAHVQVVSEEAPDAATALLATPDASRASIRSRVVCPRHLDADTAYVACVVPTFMVGRRAGLNQMLQGGRDPAWRDGDPSVELPVYHYWRFRTGPSGDFETLARKLRPVAPADLGPVGRRLVVVDPVAARLEKPGDPPEFAGLDLPVPTAIMVPVDQGPEDPTGTLSPFEDAGKANAARDPLNRRLKEILDQPEKLRLAGSDRPTVGPPIYGQWHAETRTVDADASNAAVTLDGPGAPPPWVPELNLDPEMRSAAGAATAVVQHDQEELMASAWDQLEAVVQANRRSRWTQLFARAAGSMHVNWLQPRSPAVALRVAGPALTRLRFDPTQTVATRLADTPMPPVLVSPGFARAARFASRFAGRAPASAVVGSIAPLLIAGSSTLPTRYDAPPARVDPATFGELLKAAGAEDRIQAATGLSIDEHVARLRQLPQLVRAADVQLAQAPPPGRHRRARCSPCRATSRSMLVSTPRSSTRSRALRPRWSRSGRSRTSPSTPACSASSDTWPRWPTRRPSPCRRARSPPSASPPRGVPGTTWRPSTSVRPASGSASRRRLRRHTASSRRRPGRATCRSQRPPAWPRCAVPRSRSSISISPSSRRRSRASARRSWRRPCSWSTRPSRCSSSRRNRPRRRSSQRCSPRPRWPASWQDSTRTSSTRG